MTESHLIIATAALSIIRSGSRPEGAPSYICFIDRVSLEAADVHSDGILWDSETAAFFHRLLMKH